MTATISRRVPSGKKIRDRQRLAHLVTGTVLIFYVYLPGTPSPVLQASIRRVILPLLVIDGVLMWQWAKVRRLARRWVGNS